MVNSVKPYSLRASVRIRAPVNFFRTRHRPDASSSSRRDNSTHRAAILLRHADPGELFPASLLRLRCSGIVMSGAVLALTTVFPRRYSRFLSRSRGKKKKSHKKRKYSSTSSSSSHRSSFSSFRERERKWYKSKEETH